MSADVVARALAATAGRNAAPPAFAFVDISTRALPAAAVSVTVTVGAYAAVAIADARATAAVALAHPRFCKADATGRFFRLISSGGAIGVEQGGAVGTGNDQPAIQATVAYANAVGIGRVVATLPAYEMWCPVRTSGFNSLASDGIPLVITAPVHIDFGGATITLKGPGGTDRELGQGAILDGGGKPWIGGWCYVVGSAGFGRVTLENVKVVGKFTGIVRNNGLANLSDKGFRIHDTEVAEVYLRNVELAGFAGEIYYASGGSVGYQQVEYCHFHTSPQSAFNPGGGGKLLAVEVHAGNTYQAMEVLGHEGRTFIGCRFYDAYSTSIFGGPDPSPPSGYPYFYAKRRADAAPPFVHFDNTRFENLDQLRLGAWVRGRIVTIDTAVSLTNDVVKLQDIDLDIEAWCDRKNGDAAVTIGGPANLATQVPGAPAGVYYETPSNIAVRLNCRRTRMARESNYRHGQGVRIYDGLLDHNSISFTIDGDALSAWDLNPGPIAAGFGLPLMTVADSLRSLGQIGGGAYDVPSPDGTPPTDLAAVKPRWPALVYYPAGADTYNASLDLAYSYVEGQELRLIHGGGGSADRIVAFAKNGAGMRLNADRDLRRPGEELRLRFSAFAGKFVEANYSGQGA